MFALVETTPLSLVAGPWGTIPQTIEVASIRVHGAKVGYTNGNLLLVDVVLAGSQPTEYHTLNNQSYERNGNTLTVTRTWTAPTLAAVKTALKNRLDQTATQEWIKSRGAKAAQIEIANSNGASAIDGAGTIAAAFSAYNAVTWP